MTRRPDRRRGLHVVVEALCLGPHMMGTQTHTLSIIRSLARHREIRQVDVLVPTVVPDYAQPALTSHRKIVVRPCEWLETGDVSPLPDVLFRPYAVHDEIELPWLQSHASRVIINWLDLIGYRRADYFPHELAWTRYREATARTLAEVDGVALLSQHALNDLRSEHLLPLDMPAAVVGAGVEHAGEDRIRPRVPVGADGLGAFVLVVGASYLHKNRVLALEVLAELRARGWDGSLVFAGPDPAHGSSIADEAEFLRAHPDLAASVVSLGVVDEAEKAWLYRSANLVLYPTSAEGFGFVPFEAAQHGTPCLSSRMGSLDEVLGPDVPTIADWAPGRIADQAFQLLTDRRAAAQLVAVVRKRSRRHTWPKVADAVVGLMQDVVRNPTRHQPLEPDAA